MPHTTDKRIRNELRRLLYLPETVSLQVTGNRPGLDATDRGQLAFQALLFDCLMSTRSHPHPLEQPERYALASINGYLNAICRQPDRLEIHTNTACRIASRLLPYRHDDHGLCGIPGLRPTEVSDRHVGLIHLPTGARLDLIDSHRGNGSRLMGVLFERETRWHHRDGRAPLWRQDTLADEEAAHGSCWEFTVSTPLRSALLMRSMPLWYRFDLAPARVTGHPTRPDRLAWASNSDTEHSQVVDLLTRSEARIPGARYHQRTPSSGILEVGAASALLIST